MTTPLKSTRAAIRKPAAAPISAPKRAPSAAAPKKPVQKAPVAVATKPVSANAEAKAEKTKKAKLVRDSFTIPKLEYAAIDELKQRCTKMGRVIKKSELLRAGLKALVAMTDVELQKAVQAVPAIKTGRPKA